MPLELAPVIALADPALSFFVALLPPQRMEPLHQQFVMAVDTGLNRRLAGFVTDLRFTSKVPDLSRASQLGDTTQEEPRRRLRILQWFSVFRAFA